MADTLSRPPEAVPMSESTTVAGVMVPSRSLANFLHVGGTAGAPPGVLAAAVNSGLLPSISFINVVKAQAICNEVAALHASSVLDIQRLFIGKAELWCDCSTGSPLPLVSRSLQHAVFDQLYNVAHPGIGATGGLIASRFVWAHMAKTIGAWARECISCKQSKTTGHVHLQPAVIPVPVRRFSHVHNDRVGLLPQSSGFTQILTVMDHSTHWPEAVPLADAIAGTIARTLLHHWVSCCGMPDLITSDRGPQFSFLIFSLGNSVRAPQHRARDDNRVSPTV